MEVFVAWIMKNLAFVIFMGVVAVGIVGLSVALAVMKICSAKRPAPSDNTAENQPQ